MSHLKERTEKNCLNCNAVVHGRYCHMCGQENLKPEETTWHLISHFFNDITHFDGKFFSTLKYLIFKPGFLSREYKAGRRASYLNPVRMYVFTSAIFFLIFFSVTHVGDNVVKRTYNGKSVEDIQKMSPQAFEAFTKKLNDGKSMTRAEFQYFRDTVDKKSGLHFATEHYNSKAQYDSLLKSGKVKDNWIERKLQYKEFEMNEKYHGNQNEIVKAFINNLFHSFPQMLFLSLPLFALMLKLLYKRHKDFYYVSHAIFSIQYYVFVFIMMLLIILLQQINEGLHISILDWLCIGIFFLVFFYLYKAMRNFYRQRRAKTILKFVLLNLMMVFVIALLFIVFTFFSLLKI